ncbi:MAG: hypothetical protein A7315_15040 [Candidatus Altiarchaeales archaeon WOR_SM1_79]|nr:MAG: hypothetical protein A7315_15040 [Candidatus Altiarchaeales archaeon WOR_SM1_79]
MADLWSDSAKLHRSFGFARFTLQILESEAIKWFCDPKMRKICEANFSTQNSKGILIVAFKVCFANFDCLRSKFFDLLYFNAIMYKYIKNFFKKKVLSKTWSELLVMGAISQSTE